MATEAVGRLEYRVDDAPRGLEAVRADHLADAPGSEFHVLLIHGLEDSIGAEDEDVSSLSGIVTSS